MAQATPLQLDQVQHIAIHVLDDFLGIHMEPANDANGLAGVEMASRVFITGAWDGSICVLCSTALARRITSAMFGLPEGQVSAEQIQDALGELVNILGGNIKSLVPSPSSLSLPFHGGEPEPGELLCELDMRSGGDHRLQLRVLEYKGRETA